MNKKAILFAALLGAALLALTGCENLAHDLHKKGGGAGKAKDNINEPLAPPGPPGPLPLVPSITVSPGSLSLLHGKTAPFSATVTGLDNQAVTWSVSGNATGTAADSAIDGSGLLSVYLNEPGDTILTVTATSVADPTVTDTATVTVVPLFSVIGGQTGTLTITYTDTTVITGTVNPAGGVDYAPGALLPPGGVAGDNGGTMDNCSNSGEVTGTGDYTGGVVGWSYDATGSSDAAITACFNTGTVDGVNYVGGVAGQNSAGNGYTVLMTACYNSGTVTGTGTDIGGVVGRNQQTSGTATVTACYNSGAVTGAGSNKGGVAGNIAGGSTVSACYWLLRADGNATGTGTGSGDVTSFAAAAWPQTSTNPAWGTGSGGPNGWWKTLGSWNGGNPQFPQLYWEE